MNKEIYYPIKYAVLELKEKGGWAVGYENITQGYIVSKCYVIGSTITYNKDGSNKITHKVLFPFKDIETFKNSVRYGRQNIGKENIPHYDAWNNVWDADIVDELFDSYEAAKELANEKNEDYEYNILLRTPVQLGAYMMGNDNLENELKNNFKKSIEICNLFESIVTAKTENMDISEEIEKNIIKVLKPTKKQI